MAQSFIALIALAILIRMSARADVRFSNYERLPMHWGTMGLRTGPPPSIGTFADTTVVCFGDSFYTGPASRIATCPA